MPMPAIIRRYWAQLQCMLMGAYIVSEDLSYGQFMQRETRARFYSLERAKAFAKRLMPQFGERVVVLDGMSLHPLFIYRQRR
jgi:hypothetical protein